MDMFNNILNQQNSWKLIDCLLPHSVGHTESRFKIPSPMYLFVTMLGLHWCMRAFSSCSEEGLFLVLVRGFSWWWPLLLWSTGSRHLWWPLLLWSTGSRHLCRGSVLVALELWSVGSRVLCMGLVAPQPVGSSQTRIKPMSPALAGGFLTTGPPGMSEVYLEPTSQDSS